MLMMELEVPPGAPTVERAGPALPALLMKMTLCLYTTCESPYHTLFQPKLEVCFRHSKLCINMDVQTQWLTLERIRIACCTVWMPVRGASSGHLIG